MEILLKEVRGNFSDSTINMEGLASLKYLNACG